MTTEKMTNNGSSNGDHQVILATGSYDHTIKLWQLNTGACQRTAQHTDSQVNALAITPDRKLLAAAGHQHIRMYDLLSTNSNPVFNYESVSKNVTGVGFHIEGKWMYAGGEDTYTRIWDIRTRNLKCQRMFQVNAPINCVCLHPNQSELLVGDQSGVIHQWDLKTDHNEQLIPESDASVQSIAINEEGTMMAAVNNKGNCYIWSLTSLKDETTKLKPCHKIQAHRRYSLKCKISPDSKYLVTTSADMTARIWDTQEFKLHRELKHELQRWVWDAEFSADSKYLITASSDGAARLWDIEAGTIEKEFTGHQKAVTALAFSDQPPLTS